MILLICGGRDFTDAAALHRAMILIPLPSIIIEGGARGADHLAKEWAKAHGVHYAEVPALWDFYGKRKAGSLRNKAMSALKPDYCLALPGGTGTASMVNICSQLKITVWRPYD